MSWLLCLIAVVSSGHWATGILTCSWKTYPKTDIGGGTLRTVKTLCECQSTCLATSRCKGVDWNPATSGCWLVFTQGEKRPSADNDHHDYVCTDTWSVWIHTGSTQQDIYIRDINANVFMVVYGKNKYGESIMSDVITLDDEKDNFEAGQVDLFKVEIIDFGKPYKIRIWHDSTDPESGWLLDKVEMQNIATGIGYTFSCGCWLSKNKDDGSTVRELPAEGGDIIKPEKVLTYSISVVTGDKPGAGTDFNVFIQVFGEQGDTGERYLEKSSTNANPFERGNTDNFTMKAVNVKHVIRILIGYYGTDPERDWFLNKVRVEPLGDPTMGATFTYNRWV